MPEDELGFFDYRRLPSRICIWGVCPESKRACELLKALGVETVCFIDSYKRDSLVEGVPAVAPSSYHETMGPILICAHSTNGALPFREIYKLLRTTASLAQTEVLHPAVLSGFVFESFLRPYSIAGAERSFFKRLLLWVLHACEADESGDLDVAAGWANHFDYQFDFSLRETFRRTDLEAVATRVSSVYPELHYHIESDSGAAVFGPVPSAWDYALRARERGRLGGNSAEKEKCHFEITIHPIRYLLRKALSSGDHLGSQESAWVEYQLDQYEANLLDQRVRGSRVFKIEEAYADPKAFAYSLAEELTLKLTDPRGNGILEFPTSKASLGIEEVGQMKAPAKAMSVPFERFPWWEAFSGRIAALATKAGYADESLPLFESELGNPRATIYFGDCPVPLYSENESLLGAVRSVSRRTGSLPEALQWVGLCSFDAESVDQSWRLMRTLEFDEAPSNEFEQYVRQCEDAEVSLLAGMELLATSADRQSRIAKALLCFRRCIELEPRWWRSVYYEAKALTYQGRMADASKRIIEAWDLADPIEKKVAPAQMDELEDLLKCGLNSALTEGNIDLMALWAKRGSALFPKVPFFAEKAAHIEGLMSSERRISIARWPVPLNSFSELSEAIDRYLLPKAKPEFHFYPSSKIVAHGSCFAQNIIHGLGRKQIDGYCFRMGEIVNSTFANLELIRWLFGESQGGLDYFWTNLLKEERSVLRERYMGADVGIMTLGVSPCFFRKDDGQFAIASPSVSTAAFLKTHDFRTTTVEENTKNIREIIQIVRRFNPSIHFVLTVSPVPLLATFEYDSPIQADCVSKSVLRVSVDSIVRGEAGSVTYFPAFEAIRWLGAYYEGAYGADDGTSRHVSEWAVDKVISAFIDRYYSSSKDFSR